MSDIDCIRDKYKFDEILYLKKYLYLPSSSLYRTLKNLYKPAYELNERIVFTYQGAIPYDLLAHLQRVIQHLDITNFFVIICNKDPTTKDLVDEIHAAYSNDDTKFELIDLDIDDQHILENISDHKPLLNPPETMCMYPWNNLEFKPNGTARPCCLFADPIIMETGKEFNVNNETFDVKELYFSPTMKTLRNDFRRGKKPSGCKKCWKEEAVYKRSDRQLYNWTLREKLFDIDYETEKIDNLTCVDLKLGNLCNLSCRICNHTLSSSWAVETLQNLASTAIKKTHPAYISLKLGDWPKKNTSFWTEFTQLLPHLIYIQFAGGEPLMLPSQFDVLAKAVELDHAKNITLRYNTNATQCPDKIFNLWKSFKLVYLDLSIDDIGQRFEYQRHGSDWMQVCANVKRFNSERRSNFKTQVSTSVSTMNILYLPELYEWYKSENFDDWWLNLVWNKEYCVTNLNPRARELVLDRLTNFDFGRHQDQIGVILALIQNSTSNDVGIFNDATKRLDLIRGQDFRMSHREIAEAMEYVLY
jgi:MoaA/NifB/PqqE/SkfB family radical SAM enzyme